MKEAKAYSGDIKQGTQAINRTSLSLLDIHKPEIKEKHHV
jgi:hypothetical protein